MIVEQTGDIGIQMCVLSKQTLLVVYPAAIRVYHIDLTHQSFPFPCDSASLAMAKRRPGARQITSFHPLERLVELYTHAPSCIRHNNSHLEIQTIES